MYETLAVERDKHLTVLTLNRPESLNALSRRMIDELRDFFWKLSEDTDTRVVLLRGAGRAFCAGLDLKEAGEGMAGAERGGVPGALRGQRHVAEVMMLMRRAPQPIVAAVQGAASASRRA
jgi:enoyl-CoA hydratase/carnithine racemase